MFARSARAAAECPAAGSQVALGSVRNATVRVEPRQSDASSCSKGRSAGCSCSKCRGWGTFLVHTSRDGNESPHANWLPDMPSNR